jgi:hypothetical protein
MAGTLKPTNSQVCEEPFRLPPDNFVKQANIVQLNTINGSRMMRKCHVIFVGRTFYLQTILSHGSSFHLIFLRVFRSPDMAPLNLVALMVIFQ